MFKVKGKKIEMIENDFGEILPINFIDGDVLDTDKIKFIIYKENEVKINKEFKPSNNVLNFTLTKEESSKLPIGYYSYGIKQYRGEELINTLDLDNSFHVKKGIKGD